jgi:hypothetical protein
LKRIILDLTVPEYFHDVRMAGSSKQLMFETPSARNLHDHQAVVEVPLLCEENPSEAAAS